MLFKFGWVWKGTLMMIGSWLLYGATGFEFTIVTLVAIIAALQTRNAIVID